MKKSFIITSMAAFAALCFSLTAQAQGPVVVSDKDDYSPGETALFQAAGFQPGELLDFSVAISDDQGNWIPDIAWADVQADASGGAEVDYVVPETWADKNLQLTVMGLSSGLIATTTFTDHSPAPTYTVTGWSISHDMSNNISVSVHVVCATNCTGHTTDSVQAQVANLGQVELSNDGSGTWSGSAQGVCGTVYTLNHIQVHATSTSQGGHNATITDPNTDTTTTAACVTNTAPVVTPVAEVHVDLGQILGCLDGNGGFGTSVQVDYSVSQVDANNFNVYATFNGGNQTLIGTVFDADGNLQLANIVPSPGSQTLIFAGPGGDTQSFSTSVTATDDATASDTETCPTVGDATVQVIYNFSGFFPPLSGQVNTKVKQGSGIPVKFSITDCSGTPITTGDHTISVAYQSGMTPMGDPTVDDAGMSGDNGINFRYDPTGMQWIFNLKTNSTYYVGATYQITAHLDDGTDHNVSIAIKR